MILIIDAENVLLFSLFLFMCSEFPSKLVHILQFQARWISFFDAKKTTQNSQTMWAEEGNTAAAAATANCNNRSKQHPK